MILNLQILDKSNKPCKPTYLQKRLFDDLGQGVLDNAWQGYNAALFAYGQTGSGKSYSMIGYGANKGIVPITCEELFKVVESNDDDKKQLRVSQPEVTVRVYHTIILFPENMRTRPHRYVSALLVDGSNSSNILSRRVMLSPGDQEMPVNAGIVQWGLF